MSETKETLKIGTPKTIVFCNIHGKTDEWIEFKNIPATFCSKCIGLLLMNKLDNLHDTKNTVWEDI